MWAGISVEACLELYIITRGYLTPVRYIDKILQDFVVPCVTFIGNDLILMHDNARPHTTRITQKYLNDVDIDVLEWTALSQMLMRRIRSRVPIPLT
nr:unnamed protein product [Callosobruchus chinensis]